MASKKTVGKRQRDRLKKAQAKREATATGTAANPTSSHATSSNTMASSGSTPRVQELDPSTYHDVEFVTYAMGLGACVTEAVTVDHRGRKLRVMMGAEPHMDLLARRLHDEKKFQSRLGFVTELFNGLLDDILLIESTLGPGAAARPLFRLGEINLAIYTMLSQSWGNIENGNHKAQVAMSFRGNPSQIKLVLARDYQHYNFARLQGTSVIGQQIDKIEQGLKDLHDALVMESQDYPMDDVS